MVSPCRPPTQRTWRTVKRSAMSDGLSVLHHQSGFFVVLHSAVMQRCGETVLDHFFFFQIDECRVQFLELIKILEDRLDDIVDHIVGDFG